MTITTREEVQQLKKLSKEEIIKNLSEMIEKERKVHGVVEYGNIKIRFRYFEGNDYLPAGEQYTWNYIPTGYGTSYYCGEGVINSKSEQIAARLAHLVTEADDD